MRFPNASGATTHPTGGSPPWRTIGGWFTSSSSTPYSRHVSANARLRPGRAVKGLRNCVGSVSPEPYGSEHPASGGRVTGSIPVAPTKPSTLSKAFFVCTTHTSFTPVLPTVSTSGLPPMRFPNASGATTHPTGGSPPWRTIGGWFTSSSSTPYSRHVSANARLRPGRAVKE